MIDQALGAVMDGDIKLFDEFDWTPERDRQMLGLRADGHDHRGHGCADVLQQA
jgi:hypothetical protein